MLANRLSAVLSLALLFSVGELRAQVFVDPDGDPLTAQPNTSGNVATFQVFNDTDVGAEFSFTCSPPPTGQVTSCNPPPGEFIPAWGWTTVSATFSTGDAGSGTVSLRASSRAGADDGWYNVTVQAPPPQISITPDGGSASALQFTSGNPLGFTVWETGGGTDVTVSFTCTPGGSVSACTPPDPIFVPRGQSRGVWAHYNTGAPGSGTVTLNGSGGGSSDVGSYNVTVTAAPPLVTSRHYGPDKRDYGLCAVPGCYAVMYRQSTAPYFSLDTPRNLTLVYNSDHADPYPFVHVDAKRDPANAGVPDKFQLQVKVNGVFLTFLNGEQTLNFQHINDGEYHRLGGQFDATANGLTATAVYPMQIIVTAVYGSSSASTTAPSILVLVNEASSAIAGGWTLSGVQRLYPQTGGSVLITEGDGSSTYFEYDSGSGTFITPAGDLSRVTQGVGIWTRAYPDSTKVRFNSAGLMNIAVDRFNNQTIFEYDSSNRPWRVTDPAGYTITLAYGANGLQSITDHFSRVTNVTVLADRRLTEIRDPDGVATTFQYAGGLRLSSITDRRGFTTSFGYDGNSGQLAGITSPPVYVWGEGERLLTTTYASWDKVGVPYGSTATAPVEPPRWDTVSGRVTDPGGHVTRYTVLNSYRQAEETYLPLGVQISTRYAAADPEHSNRPHLLRKLIQPIGAVDSIAYHPSGLPTYVQPAGETATNMRYTAWGQPDSIWGNGQPRQRMWIGFNGRVDSVETGVPGSPTKMRYAYDSRGRVTAVRDPLQHKVDSVDYGGTNGNTWKVIRPGNRLTTYGYDIYGRVTSIAQEGLPTRTIQYDLINRVTHVYDGVNPNPSRYTYDGNMLSETRDSIIDPKGQLYVNTYDRMGRLKSRQHPSGHVVASYEYSRDSEVRRVWNARGEFIDITYDALHRPTWRGGANMADASFSYSPDGRVVTDSNAIVKETTYLNVRGTPDSVRTRLAGRDYWRRYAYTAAGLLDSVWGSGVAAGFTSRNYGYHTQRGTLDSIALAGALTRFSLNADLQPSTVTFPGGDQVSRGFTGTHREMVITTSAPYNSWIDRKMTLDQPGRLWRQMDEVNGLANLYSYDGLSRLKEDLAAQGTGYPLCDTQPGPDTEKDGATCRYNFWQYWDTTAVTTFQYDEVGNRTDGGGVAYGPGNRIQSFTGCTYATDNDGNVTQRNCPGETVSITWFSDNRPSRFTVNGTTIDLMYDPAGRLVRRNLNGSPQAYFLWDGDNLFAELDGSGEKRAEYSYYPGLDNLHAVIKGTTAYYAHGDGLGNVVALSNASQQLAGYNGYDAWGQSLGGLDTLNNRARFKGALWMGPELDIYYMRNRWYEPKTGRFLSEDPIGLEGGINLYTFAGDDPVNHADPTGLSEWVCVTVSVEPKADILAASTVTSCWESGGGFDGGGIDPPQYWPPSQQGGRPSGDSGGDPQSRRPRKPSWRSCFANSVDAGAAVLVGAGGAVSYAWGSIVEHEGVQTFFRGVAGRGRVTGFHPLNSGAIRTLGRSARNVIANGRFLTSVGTAFKAGGIIAAGLTSGYLIGAAAGCLGDPNLF